VGENLDVEFGMYGRRIRAHRGEKFPPEPSPPPIGGGVFERSESKGAGHAKAVQMFFLWRELFSTPTIPFPLWA